MRTAILLLVTIGLPTGALAQGLFPEPITIQTQNTAVTAPTQQAEALQRERQRLQDYEERLQAREAILDERTELLNERAAQLDEQAEFLRQREEALTTQVPLEEPVVVEPEGPTLEGFFENDAERANRLADEPDTFRPGLPDEFTPGIPDETFSPGVQDTESDFFD